MIKRVRRASCDKITTRAAKQESRILYVMNSAQGCVRHHERAVYLYEGRETLSAPAQKMYKYFCVWLCYVLWRSWIIIFWSAPVIALFHLAESFLLSETSPIFSSPCGCSTGRNEQNFLKFNFLPRDMAWNKEQHVVNLVLVFLSLSCLLCFMGYKMSETWLQMEK